MARSRAPCGDAAAMALAACLFLIDLAISVSDSDKLDMPCPVETRRDLWALLLEGPALLVRERLRLAGGRDGDSEALGEAGYDSLL